VLGGASGVALGISSGTSLPLAAIAGMLGALVGTYAGYNIRRALVLQRHLPDFAVALAEDTVAIAGGLLIVSRF
jgi:uncharacterized membrane protein